MPNYSYNSSNAGRGAQPDRNNRPSNAKQQTNTHGRPGKTGAHARSETPPRTRQPTYGRSAQGRQCPRSRSNTPPGQRRGYGSPQGTRGRDQPRGRSDSRPAPAAAARRQDKSPYKERERDGDAAKTTKQQDSRGAARGGGTQQDKSRSTRARTNSPSQRNQQQQQRQQQPKEHGKPPAKGRQRARSLTPPPPPPQVRNRSQQKTAATARDHRQRSRSITPQGCFGGSRTRRRSRTPPRQVPIRADTRGSSIEPAPAKPAKNKSAASKKRTGGGRTVDVVVHHVVHHDPPPRRSSPSKPQPREKTQTQNADDDEQIVLHHDISQKDGDDDAERRSTTSKSSEDSAANKRRKRNEMSHAEKVYLSGGHVYTSPVGRGISDEGEAMRLLSAGRQRISELNNNVAELSRSVDALKNENRDLKRQQLLLEKRLAHYEGKDSEQPTLVQRQGQELNAVHEKLRRNKENCVDKEKKLRDTNSELERCKKELHKMKQLAGDKNLGERDQLRRKLGKAENQLNERERSIKSLEQRVETMNKTHKHQFDVERARHKAAEKEVKELRIKLDQLQMQTKEHEKESELKTAYTSRKPPHRLSDSWDSVRRGQSHQAQDNDDDYSKRSTTVRYSDDDKQATNWNRVRVLPKVADVDHSYDDDDERSRPSYRNERRASPAVATTARHDSDNDDLMEKLRSIGNGGGGERESDNERSTQRSVPQHYGSYSRGTYVDNRAGYHAASTGRYDVRYDD